MTHGAVRRGRMRLSVSVHLVASLRLRRSREQFDEGLYTRLRSRPTQRTLRTAHNTALGSSFLFSDCFLVSGPAFAFSSIPGSRWRQDASTATIPEAVSVNAKLFDGEARRAVMHCLPPIAATKSPRGDRRPAVGVVFDEAENRLHAQRAFWVVVFEAVASRVSKFIVGIVVPANAGTLRSVVAIEGAGARRLVHYTVVIGPAFAGTR